MHALRVHRSNRMERLADALADVVATPLADPLARECIVVEGRGIERWLSRQLADRLGIWAHAEFVFPRRVLQRGLAAFLGANAGPDDAFEPESLTWSIAAQLPTLLEQPAFAPVRGYLEPRDAARTLALAQRLAALLDHYVVYRPEMILRWETGQDDHWQAHLWRAIVTRNGTTHLAARCQALFAAIDAPPIEPLPQRVSLFGLSTLAPLYLRVFDALTRYCDVHLFLLNPSQAYWGTVRSRREVLRDLWRNDPDGIDLAQELDTAAGHPLLASLGRVGRDFQEVLEASCQYHEDDVSLYEDPGTDSMLATIQSDLLYLHHRRLDDNRLPLPPHDTSIRIHACHAAVREVQVLRDQLLDLFAADPTLHADEVVVLCPTIEVYAPLIQAVFGSDDGVQLPFRIADLQRRSTDDAVDAFLRLLVLLGGRLAADEVVDVLELPAVHTRFGLSPSDLTLIRSWIVDSGIRWGADQAHRVAEGQPSLLENTWRFGLDRLFLGYAMRTDGACTYAGRLPLDGIEGTHAAALGGFAEWCEALFHWRDRIHTAQPVSAWRDVLLALLDAFVAETPDLVDQHVAIRGAIDTVVGRAEAAGFDGEVELAALRPLIESALQHAAPGRGFLSGGITFCAPVPMRSIPFRVVCLLGMNDVDFPRHQPPAGFDLMARRPKAGDRNPRDDDRYLFLEALLAARERVIITYLGRSVRDNAPLPPSSVVSELLDTIDATFVGDDTTRPASAGLIVEHPLQPFSPRYFDGSDARHFSFSQRDCQAAHGLLAPQATAVPFLTTTLPQTPSRAGGPTLAGLVRFFSHPTRAFLQHRLGIYLRDGDPGLPNREPLTFDTLEAWQLGSDVLVRLADADRAAQVEEILRAEGRLPPGTIGHCVLDDLRQSAIDILETAAPFVAGDKLEPRAVELTLGEVALTGVLDELRPAGLVRIDYGNRNGTRLLAAWIEHLFLQCAALDGVEPRRILIARDGGVTFGAVDDAAEILARLVALQTIGLQQPLPLFRQSSYAFAKELLKSDQPERALAAARKAFLPGFNPNHDGDDANVVQIYGSDDPRPIDPDYPLLDPARPDLAFAPLALTVFGPLLVHLEELE